MKLSQPQTLSTHAIIMGKKGEGRGERKGLPNGEGLAPEEVGIHHVRDYEFLDFLWEFCIGIVSHGNAV